LDLVALLLDAAEPVSFAELREAFPGDYGGPRDAAERKLERDKAELLQLGVPLEFVPPSLDDEREVGGYRIDRAAFFLPDPRLRALADAVARRKRVHLRYDKFGAVTERDVDPYGLAFRGGTWRLVGYCHLRKAQRVFLVDRIVELEVNEQRPAQPDFQIPDGFDAGEAAGRRPWQWAGAEPMEVTLRFAPGSELLAERAFDA